MQKENSNRTSVKPKDTEAQKAFEEIDTLVNELDLVGIYFTSIKDSKTLSKEEEIELGKKIEAGNEAKKKLNLQDIDTRIIIELEREMEEGLAASERLVKSSLKLVVSIAKNYLKTGIPFLDLIQAGNLGLMRVARKFDYKLGHRFDTYATWGINSSIRRFIGNDGVVRVPIYINDSTRSNHYREIVDSFIQENRRDPTIEELSKLLGKGIENIKLIKRSQNKVLSFEDLSYDDENESAEDLLEDKDTEPVFEQVSRKNCREMIDKLFDKLPEREANVIRMRKGFNNENKDFTLEELSLKMGVTRERIRQIEEQAIRRLKQHRSVNELKDFW